MAASDFWGRVRKLAASLPQRAEQFVPGEIFARPLDAYMAERHPEIGEQLRDLARPENLMGAVEEEGPFAELPARSLDTLSDAIGLSSPSGKMSRAARQRAVDRLGAALFGEHGLQPPKGPEILESDRLLQQARELRDLASRGMKVRSYPKKAAELEARAKDLKAQGR